MSERRSRGHAEDPSFDIHVSDDLTPAWVDDRLPKEGDVVPSLSDARPLRRLVGVVLRLAPELAPRTEKLWWRMVYEAASLRRGDQWTSVMNYGYAPLDAATTNADLSDVPYGLQLYARVAGAASLEGKDVLEVGCGRGGGTAFVQERFRPRSMVGLDLATRAIDACRAAYARPGLRFVAGDAENLPFDDASFDVVLNVESSHCYADMQRFLGEVHRVLRPGGLLLIADARETLSEPHDGALFAHRDVPTFRQQLADASFETLEEEDITKNVMRALVLDTPSRRARVEKRVPRLLRPYVHAFAAAEGSPMYRAYDEGQRTYLRFVLQRADPSEPDGSDESRLVGQV